MLAERVREPQEVGDVPAVRHEPIGVAVLARPDTARTRTGTNGSAGKASFARRSGMNESKTSVVFGGSDKL